LTRYRACDRNMLESVPGCVCVCGMVCVSVCLCVRLCVCLSISCASA